MQAKVTIVTRVMVKVNKMGAPDLQLRAVALVEETPGLALLPSNLFGKKWPVRLGNGQAMTLCHITIASSMNTYLRMYIRKPSILGNVITGGFLIQTGACATLSTGGCLLI